MSRLTEALNRIIKYLEKNNPDAANWLQSGLSDTEIANITKDLPFQLPSEIKELYRWRNGRVINEHNWGQAEKSAFIFPAYGYYFLCSLEEVVQNYQESLNYSYGQNELEIFQSLPEGTGYVDLYNKRVVFYYSSDRVDVSSSYQYTSLTTMMQTIAEGYETGIYGKECYIQELQNSVLSSTKLWWKYNSDIQDLLLMQLKDIWEWSPSYLLSFKYDLILFKDPIVVPVLIEIIQTPISKIEQFNKQNRYHYECIVKKSMIETLGLFEDLRAVEPIITILRDRNPDKSIRITAIEALRLLKSNLAIQPLIEILQNNETELISSASWALINLGKEAVEPLIRILQHDDSDVQMFVANTLGKIGDKKAIQPLYNLFKNQTSTSHELLYTLGSGGFPPIASALAELQAIDELIASLNNPNAIVRQQAAWALGNIIDLRVVPQLIKTLEDRDKEVQEEARESLVKLSSQIPEIESMLPF